MARVLVIDDNESIRRSLGRLLAHAGHEVRDAANGHDALQKYRRAPADIVITDILMPDKEGLETIRELRRLHQDVRIIAISGGGIGDANQYLEMARRFGATRTLSKPFTRDDVLALVDEVLSEQCRSAES